MNSEANTERVCFKLKIKRTALSLCINSEILFSRVAPLPSRFQNFNYNRGSPRRILDLSSSPGTRHCRVTMQFRGGLSAQLFTQFASNYILCTCRDIGREVNQRYCRDTTNIGWTFHFQEFLGIETIVRYPFARRKRERATLSQYLRDFFIFVSRNPISTVFFDLALVPGSFPSACLKPDRLCR